MVAFVEDFFGVAVLAALVVFTVIRIKQNPHRQGRLSRFYGSHTGAAWLVLFMIFDVVWTLFLYRGAQINTGNFPYPDQWAFASQAVAALLEPLGLTANERIETVAILLQIAVILGFLVLVVYSKHLHIGLAPINVGLKRQPNALGTVAADVLPRPADRLRGPQRRRRLRGRQGRRLHLEGPARLRDLHRVRPLPVAVPGVEHREAADPEAVDHGAARPRVRQGALPGGRAVSDLSRGAAEPVLQAAPVDLASLPASARSRAGTPVRRADARLCRRY